MKLILFLYDHLCWMTCRHEWVRERRRGELWECCMKCLKRRPDRMTALVRWQPPNYVPVEPIDEPEFPPALVVRGKTLRRAA